MMRMEASSATYVPLAGSVGYVMAENAQHCAGAFAVVPALLSFEYQNVWFVLAGRLHS